MEYSTLGHAAPVVDEAVEAPAGDAPGEQSSPLGAGAHEQEPGSPNGVDDDNLDADHDMDAPLRFQSIDDIIGQASPRGFAPRALVMEELHVVTADEPTTFTDAERSPGWRKVMMEEMESIKENGTWCLADLPPDHPHPVTRRSGSSGSSR